VVPHDGTHCACLTVTHAIEFDFANTWAEEIGQALHSASMTGKRASLVLKTDKRYLNRVLGGKTEQGLELDVWTQK
jgi:hypothetical protein